MIKERSDALRDGSVFYDPKELCKRGHVSLRYAVNAACVECIKSALNSKDFVSFNVRINPDHEELMRAFLASLGSGSTAEKSPAVDTKKKRPVFKKPQTEKQLDILRRCEEAGAIRLAAYRKRKEEEKRQIEA